MNDLNNLKRRDLVKELTVDGVYLGSWVAGMNGWMV